MMEPSQQDQMRTFKYRSTSADICSGLNVLLPLLVATNTAGVLFPASITLKGHNFLSAWTEGSLNLSTWECEGRVGIGQARARGGGDSGEYKTRHQCTAELAVSLATDVACKRGSQ
jgi:hypothetical protein